MVGYFAINPTQVVREQAPLSLSRGWPLSVPAWNLGKLAVHVDLRADKDAQWGRQLLREALETIVRVADAGGGKVIVVDADHPGLLDVILSSPSVSVPARWGSESGMRVPPSSWSVLGCGAGLKLHVFIFEDPHSTGQPPAAICGTMYFAAPSFLFMYSNCALSRGN